MTQLVATNDKGTPVFAQLVATNRKDTPVFAQLVATNRKDTPVFTQLVATNSKDTPVFTQLVTTNDKDTPVFTQLVATNSINTLTLVDRMENLGRYQLQNNISQTEPFIFSTLHVEHKRMLTKCNRQGGKVWKDLMKTNNREPLRGFY